ncbi:flavodoxin-dependent (E)-4-hydroxy-3-methylbut-2-enyl-diphosphate synthase [Pseudomonadota bacterium]
MKNPYQIKRRETKQINVGDVKVGGNAPISVQSMTNTLTTNIEGTVKQVNDCVDYGVELMRISVPNQDSADALKKIIPRCKVPIIADIHFDFNMAIESAKAGAKCLRINPGNVGNVEKIQDIIKAAKDYNCSIRIGVNSGSLSRELLQKYGEPCVDAMIESAMEHIKILEDNEFFETKIAMKASGVFLTMESYRELAKLCNYPFHLGVTEAGTLIGGTVKSSVALGSLLLEGIGDTIRVSLSADPIEEVKVGNLILKSIGLRNKGINIVSCPTCARKGFDVISVVNELEKKTEKIQKPITISVLGCIVNGIGEAEHSDIGIVGGTKDEHLLYFKGKKHKKIKTEDIVDEVLNLVKNLQQ